LCVTLIPEKVFYVNKIVRTINPISYRRGLNNENVTDLLFFPNFELSKNICFYYLLTNILRMSEIRFGIYCYPYKINNNMTGKFLLSLIYIFNNIMDEDDEDETLINKEESIINNGNKLMNIVFFLKHQYVNSVLMRQLVVRRKKIQLYNEVRQQYLLRRIFAI